MPNQFAAEHAAIVNLRKKYPNAGKLTLAKRIAGRSFDLKADNDVARAANGSLSPNTSGRTVLSIYSVIRRFDRSVKRLVQNAAEKANTGLALASA